jgi:hypothetical protein
MLGRRRLSACTWVIVTLLVACNDSNTDNLIGSPCTQQGQCRVTCETPSNDFPGGLCTVPCDHDSQCPHGTYCMAIAGGVCLFPCAQDQDCAFLGDHWFCRNLDRAEGDKRLVCIGD